MRTTTPGSSGWVPPHCPNRNCPYHKYFRPLWVYRHRGSYRRQCDGRRVRRFDCTHCRISFSTQTFSPDYWLKRPDLLHRLFMRVCGCMGNRQIARDFGCAPETIGRLVARLGRHCMLYHWQQYGGSVPQGPVVFDGFESFEYSQYHPILHHLAVEADTGFWLYHTDSELRRKGRMTRYQRRRRAELEEKLGRPDRQAILTVWRNYVERRRERGPEETAAMLRGVLTKPITPAELLRFRLFPERIRLPDRWRQYYDRAVTSREFRTSRRHALHYAY